MRSSQTTEQIASRWSSVNVFFCQGLLSVLRNLAILYPMNAHDSLDLVRAIQIGKFTDARLEVKRAQKGLPQH